MLTRILLAEGADLKVLPVTKLEMSSVDAAGVVKLQLLQKAVRDAIGGLPVPGQMLAGSAGEGTPVRRRRLRRLPSPSDVPAAPPVSARCLAAHGISVFEGEGGGGLSAQPGKACIRGG